MPALRRSAMPPLRTMTTAFFPVSQRRGRALSPARERGVALLALVVFLGLVASLFVVRSLSADTLRARLEQRTTEALVRAKEALLAYAVANINRPGGLPCPDWDGDGRSVPPTEYAGGTCVNGFVGRVPWRTLGLAPVADGSGETIWFAMSNLFQDAQPLGTAPFINPDTPAALAIAGQANDLVAVLFAPGAPLQGQIRNDALSRMQSINFLEGSNGTGVPPFLADAPSATFNDRLLAISRQELMAQVQLRVASETARALADYFALYGFLPAAGDFGNVQCVDQGVTAGCQPLAGLLAGRVPANASPGFDYVAGRPQQLLRGNVNSPTDWFQLQRWRENVIYLVSPECVGPPANFCAQGALSVRGPGIAPIDNARFVVLMGGVAVVGQQRATPADRLLLVNYVEGSELLAVQQLVAGAVPAQIVVNRGTVVATR